MIIQITLNNQKDLPTLLSHAEANGGLFQKALQNSEQKLDVSFNFQNSKKARKFKKLADLLNQ